MENKAEELRYTYGKTGKTPYELELQSYRRVLYIHTLTGTTKLRICRLPTRFVKSLVSKTFPAMLDLIGDRPETESIPKIKNVEAGPVFIEVDKDHKMFFITNPKNEILAEFHSVPVYILDKLAPGSGFVDITVGFIR